MTLRRRGGDASRSNEGQPCGRGAGRGARIRRHVHMSGASYPRNRIESVRLEIHLPESYRIMPGPAGPPTFADAGHRLGRPLVLGPEPAVAGDVSVAQVTVVEAVMELVEEVAQQDDAPALEQQALEPGVRGRRTQGVPLQVQDDMQWMRGYDQVDQHAAEVDDMLDRMHRQAGPGSDIVVAVVHRVREPVHRLPVQEAMGEVEVQRLPERDGEGDRHQADGMSVEPIREPRRVPVVLSPPLWPSL